MSIKTFTKDGATFYNVRVTKRSKKDPSIRVEKSKTNIATFKEAKRCLENFKDEVIAEVIAREQRGASWTYLIERWEKAVRSGSSFIQVSKTTAEDYLTALRIYVPHWNERLAEQIHRSEVIQVLNDMDRKGLSRSRKQCLLIALNQVFKFGIDLGLVKGLQQSPGAGISLKKGEEKRPEILTLAQIKRLLECARLYAHPWYEIWAVALHTGMRSGELHELRWDDIDLDNKKICVQRAWSSRARQVKCTKAGYWRYVPINAELMQILKELKLQRGTEAFVLPRFSEWTRGTGTAGVLRQFCVSIGIPSVKFHALRACFATHLLRENVPPATVMKICGWKDMETMMVYVRLAGIEIDGATDNLSFLSEPEAMGKVMNLFSND